MTECEEYERVLLHRIDMALQARMNMAIASGYPNRVVAKASFDRIVDGMLIRVTNWSYGKKHTPTTVEFPTTWWDGFKERFFYDWMKKRWPVQITKVDFHRDVVYPTIHLGKDDHEPIEVIYRQDVKFYRPEKDYSDEAP